MDFNLPIFDRLQDCWEPLSQADIDDLAGGLGVSFPDDYRDFLSLFNGGVWSHAATTRVREPSRFVDQFAVNVSFGVVRDERFGFADISHTADVFSGRIPESFVPIMYSWGDLVCMDFSQEDYGKVFYWNKLHEDSDMNLVYLIADSFSEFLQSLKADDELERWSEQLPAFQFAERGDRHAIFQYLGHGKPDERNEKRWTLLMCAARNSWPRIVDILLRAGADPNALDADGWSPLHHAVWGGSFDSVKHLIAAGANTHYRDDQGQDLAQIAEGLNDYRLQYHLAPYVS